MGKGCFVRCEKCGREDNILIGVSGDHSEFYQQTVKDIRKGKYGKEWKELFKSRKHMAVNAEKKLYVCKSCGTWKVEADLSLYAPTNPENIKKEPSYVYLFAPREDYTLVKEYTHFCDKCGGIAESKPLKCTFKGYEADGLRCPDCGGECKTSGLIMWD